MERVALAKCTSYDGGELYRKMMQSVELCGFDTSLFRNARVAMKPNLLAASTPEKAVITHPEFFHAAVKLVRSMGGKPVLIESPAVTSAERVMKKGGYDRIIEKECIPVWDQVETGVLYYEGAVNFKRFEIARPLFESDIILNLPKLKTHHLTHLTAAVKNLFGVLPGLAKSRWHIRARTPEEFAGFLVDLYSAMIHALPAGKNMLTIVDAITGMEGDGPGSGGTPRFIGAIITGMDAVAVDHVCAGITGMDAAKIPTLTIAAKRSVGAPSLDRIECAGGGIGEYKIDGFREPGGGMAAVMVNLALRFDFLKNLMLEKPVPMAERCTLCLQCRKICPAGAIAGAAPGGKVPLYDYGRCIRCYCCMEVCPDAAIKLRKGGLQWIIDKFDA